MKIKALVPFSNGTLSMEQYQVAEVTDTLGNQLIAAGVAIEIGGGGSGGGVLVVHETLSGADVVLDKNYNEITAAMLNGGAYIVRQHEDFQDTEFRYIASIGIEEGVYFVDCDESNAYEASSATGVLTKTNPK